ncbi:2-oxo acid dehydrogenase subunit E2 [Halalkalibacter krulwichiae]|uniref:Dihydrolipoyllysine-residue acetyltransferase component of pyruvate dehydrogenase complex n=1 Tax=Halalkalibacter krulwichiae TaxID=199441 RepID=A0A1X9M8G5_9BACI|nr:2-oxo acid dehydrogenase subunit E2 [Halalkalibacter krulwichiae]ARK29725.1 Dihydrolipoyllysine-residue acetyltransferase component of pyruvate dehydrogenase complex [Halalkalibacter krulwichiae]
MIQFPVKHVIASPRARAKAKNLGINLSEFEGSGPLGRIIESDVIFNHQQTKSNVDRILPQSKASPLAKKMAEVEQVSLHLVEGSGVGGKIVSKDIHNYLNSATPTIQEMQRKPLQGIRKIIADKMTYSKKNIPHVTLTVKVDASDLVDFRDSIKSNYENVSYTDLLIKILAKSLKQFPSINVSLEEDTIISHEDVNVGMAVAISNGLVVPVIQNANEKTITEIAKLTSELVNKAQKGKLTSTDLSNGRFTLSNLGMYAVDGFTPIINPPESAILGVGRIKEDLFVENSQIRIGKSLVLSLSFDHRVIDGAPAAEFLGYIKELIENSSFLNRSLGE